MIHVNRAGHKVPASLDGEDSRGGRETRAAIDHFEGGQGIFKDFKEYKKDEVKSALLKLFGDKCAYCEIDYGGAALDVEHFRPKLGYACYENGKRKMKKPGYYWLGADWNNLLPSCQDCNRPRSHEVADGRKEVLGKWNFFPLSDESKRARKPIEQAAEEEFRLLIDPCVDRPEDHLVFLGNGTVRAATHNGAESMKGKESIKHFGLMRNELVRKRRDTAIRVKFILAQIAEELGHHDSDVTRAEKKQRIKENLLHLNEQYHNSHAPFQALVCALINSHLPKLDPAKNSVGRRKKSVAAAKPSVRGRRE